LPSDLCNCLDKTNLLTSKADQMSRHRPLLCFASGGSEGEVLGAEIHESYLVASITGAEGRVQAVFPMDEGKIGLAIRPHTFHSTFCSNLLQFIPAFNVIPCN